MKNTKQDWRIKADVMLDSFQLSGQMITYADFAELVGIELPHRIHKLTLWLEDTMRADAEAGRLLRAAFVISKTRGMPAPGFFIILRELGLYSGADTGAEAAACHAACLKGPLSKK